MKSLRFQVKDRTTGKPIITRFFTLDKQERIESYMGLEFSISDRDEHVQMTDSERLKWMSERESTYLTCEDQKFLKELSEKVILL